MRRSAQPAGPSWCVTEVATNVSTAAELAAAHRWNRHISQADASGEVQRDFATGIPAGLIVYDTHESIRRIPMRLRVLQPD
jgi:hypothetical protein